MKTLEIDYQSNAEWSGEAYLPINEENVKKLLMRVNDHPDNPEHELDDYDAMRLGTEMWMLFEWLEVPMAAFIPYTHVKMVGPMKSKTFRVKEIDIGSPMFPVSGVPEGEECFIIRFDYW